VESIVSPPENVPTKKLVIDLNSPTNKDSKSSFGEKFFEEKVISKFKLNL